MDRQIEFRIWDSLLQKWYEPTYEAYKGNLHEVFISLNGRLVIRTLNRLEDESLWSDRYKLSQYTTLRDINNVKVFENDIVRSSNGQYIRVKWTSNTYRTGWNLNTAGKAEVVGNIYQNVELLEKLK